MTSKDPSSTTLDQMEPPEPGPAAVKRVGELSLSDLEPLSDGGPFDHVQPEVSGPEWIGKKLGGRYAIVGTVGKGGAGHVFRAVQEPLGREVAVKVLRTDLPPVAQKTFADRFLREAALAGRLAHPALVTVHDYGHQAEDADGVLAGTRWVVMELLEGRTLWTRIRQEGSLEPTEAARIAAALARGLRHAHTHGLVHRDVKPNNIVLVPDDDGVEQPKLVDFGLVKPAVEEELLTEVGRYMGTPAYMAPEQAEGKSVDGRADQYALGCVLYHMLSGVVPFEANTPLGVAVQHKTDQVPPISRRSGVAVAPQLEAVVRRSMQKDPGERFADCGEMAEALEAWLTGLQPAAPRRRPVGWVLAGGAVALVGAGLAGLGLVAGGAGLAVGVWSQGTPVEEPLPVVAPADPEEGEGTEAADATVELAGEPDGVVADEEPDDDAEIDATNEEGPPDAPAPKPSAAAPKPSPAPPAPQPAPAQPAPAPAPAAVPAPAPVVEPAPVAAPAPAPIAEPAPVDAPAGMVRFDDVAMTPADAAAAVAWINGATAEELAAAGVYRRGVEVVLDNRPFADMKAFAATRMIGTKTVEAALHGAGRR